MRSRLMSSEATSFVQNRVVVPASASASASACQRASALGTGPAATVVGAIVGGALTVMGSAAPHRSVTSFAARSAVLATPSCASDRPWSSATSQYPRISSTRRIASSQRE